MDVVVFPTLALFAVGLTAGLFLRYRVRFGLQVADVAASSLARPGGSAIPLPPLRPYPGDAGLPEMPPAPRLAEPYPLLAAIDAALGPGHVPYTAARNAAHLERRAEGLAAQHWSEFVWLTGMVDRERLEAVRAVLERERVSDGRAPQA